jgi:hypothetical protein
MTYIVRDFNVPGNDIGDITLYLYNHNKIRVNILDLHEDGQAWMIINYPPSLERYNIILSILNELTSILSVEHLSYKDILYTEDDTKIDWNYSDRWGYYIPFTRESVDLLEEYESDREEKQDHYIIRGDLLENGKLIYDKPIKSNHYSYK